ncbi:indolethylamine N-methyltransferase-like [Ascaphus truei]|uniref:indolethylamine N-methyltransferase-like n=1 Tax=Ascaphus truei TaxID=8439 RepID=UPI003F59BC33
MDSSLHKHYHDEEFDPRLYIETYYYPENSDVFEDAVEFPITQLFKTFSSGRVRGETLLDVSAGPLAFHLLTACDFFKEINVIEFTDANIREFEMWRNKEPGAADWSHAAKFICELEGKSDEWEGKEDKARRAVKRVVKRDFTKDNPLEPVVLPQVDCLISMYVLILINKDHQAYRSNLKKLASMLKIGGHMLLVGTYNETFYRFGEHKFYTLSCNEEFIREAVCDAGFIIENLEVLPSKKTSNYSDYTHVMFLVARKEKEV